MVGNLIDSSFGVIDIPATSNIAQVALLIPTLTGSESNCAKIAKVFGILWFSDLPMLHMIYFTIFQCKDSTLPLPIQKM